MRTPGTEMAAVKLLVVEDDVANLELMTEVLTSLKAEVRALSSSQEADALVNREKFDGIFLDLEMPGLDGFQLAEKVRNSSWNKTTPIVVVTGRDQRDTMRHSFRTGATFFLQKPVDRQIVTRLFQAVRGAMLENRRRYSRVPLQTELTCVVDGRTLRGRTWNLSKGGMQVEVDSLTVNGSVRLSFKLPNHGNVIDVLGTIVWVKHGRQGVRFTKVAPNIQDQIERFIEQVEASLK